jgi:hypothetical protein
MRTYLSLLAAYFSAGAGAGLSIHIVVVPAAKF